MTGGFRFSVKGYLIGQRPSKNEIINNTDTAPLDLPPHLVEEMTMDSTTKRMDRYRTRSRVKSPPPQGVSSSSNILSVSVPSSPQTMIESLQSLNLMSFHYNELRMATRNFRLDSILGDGGFGSIFKGWIDEHTFTAAKCGKGMAIIVKRLNKEGTSQSDKDWLTEVYCLGQLSHPNLVKLIGYCLEDDERLLVYEYIQGGSLENHLFRRGFGCRGMSWNIRIKIALNAAKALAFLHSDAKCLFVDLDTSMILLDSDCNAKLYGYGFGQQVPEGYRSRLLDKAVSHYVAPEYVCGGADHLSPRSDVYSFGVVLLEILSGRRAIDRERPTAEADLVQLAKVSRKQTVHQVVDIRMEGQFSESEAFKAVKLAVQCLSKESRRRPDMHQVIEILEKLQSSGH